MSKFTRMIPSLNRGGLSSTEHIAWFAVSQLSPGSNPKIRNDRSFRRDDMTRRIAIFKATRGSTSSTLIGRTPSFFAEGRQFSREQDISAEWECVG